MNSTGGASVADLRDHIAAMSAGLKTLHASVFQCPTGELGEFLGELAELRALAGAATAVVAADAEGRGVVEASQSASTRGWVAEYGWHSRREATTIAKAAHILRRPDLAEIADSIHTADLDLPTAVVVQAEYDKLAPDLMPGAHPMVLEQLVNHGAEYDPRGVRELRQWIIAHHGKQDQFTDFQDRCRRSISLSSPRQTSTGLHEYRLVVDNEGLSILEAAIQALAAPRPSRDTDNRDTGERDERPTDRRRGDGERHHEPQRPATAHRRRHLCRDDRRRHPAGTRHRPQTCLRRRDHPHRSRRRRRHPGVRHRATFVRPPAETHPVAAGSTLHFPRLRHPAQWCDAHHLVHWVDGGPTDLDNAALLCGRHHTIVHRDELHGEVTAGHVVWDRRPGSYRPTPRPYPDPERTPVPPDPLLPRQRSAATVPLRT